MFHLIGTVFFTYNAHITLHALVADSTSQRGLLFAGFSLVFLFVRQHFYLTKKRSFHFFFFFEEESTGNTVSAVMKVIYIYKSGGFSVQCSTIQYSAVQYSTVQISLALLKGTLLFSTNTTK